MCLRKSKLQTVTSLTTAETPGAWRIPGTAEPGGLPSMGSHRVRHQVPIKRIETSLVLH